MAQLTIYLDEDTRRKIEQAARKANLSVSRWVKERLSRAIETEWPSGYFATLGSLSDDDLERPPEPGPLEEREPL